MGGFRLYFSEVFCDVGVVKVVHFVHHPNCAVYDGKGAESSGALSETHPQAQQRLSMHQIEHPLVSAFVPTVSEDGVVEDGGMKS